MTPRVMKINTKNVAVECVLINSSQVRMPRVFIQRWMREVIVALRQRHFKLNQYKTLSIVFLDLPDAKELNFRFREKKYATDILSFEGDGENSLGELVLCPQVLRRQAYEHGLSFRQELGYMLIHGMLHLLGLDHEKSQKEARYMFQIQDDIFEKLLVKFSCLVSH